MAKRRAIHDPSRGPNPIQGPAAVILAAGASRRLGQCKALVELDGRTVLDRLVEAARGFGPRPALVVVGAHADAIAARLPEGCEVLHNQDWEAGRSGGLALAACQRPGLDLAILPVDVPRIAADLCRAMAEAWLAQGRPELGWLAPRHRGQFGHPVLIGKALARRLGSFKPDQPLSDLRQRARPLLSLETDCAAILEDLDTPLDLARLLGSRGEEASGPSIGEKAEEE